MPKGRTSSALTIAVPPGCAQHPKVLELVAKGHTVEAVDLSRYDLVLFPQAHYWDDGMWDYLAAAMTAARKRKKEGKQ